VEHSAGQLETERYLNYVADKFGLWRDIQLKTVVTAAHYREDTGSWDVTLYNGGHCTSRLLITAAGVLSAQVLPRIPGVENFQRPQHHYRADAEGLYGGCSLPPGPDGRVRPDWRRGS
jgi:cation diffusion facilitator CzcD-associated flavoprotein CzcO